jgi:hypothetical protein
LSGDAVRHHAVLQTLGTGRKTDDTSERADESPPALLYHDLLSLCLDT